MQEAYRPPRSCSLPISWWGGPPQSTPEGGGGVTPSSLLIGGGTPGYPHWGLPSPHPDLGRGYPSSWPGKGYSLVLTWEGVLPSSWPGNGVPSHRPDGVPLVEVWTDKQTENNTFPHPSEAGGNKKLSVISNPIPKWAQKRHHHLPLHNPPPSLDYQRLHHCPRYHTSLLVLPPCSQFLC